MKQHEGGKNEDALSHYYNDVNIRLLTYLTMIYDSKRNKYNLDYLCISYNEYFSSKVSDARIRQDLNVLAEHYLDDGSMVLVENENTLIMSDITDARILLDKIVSYSKGDGLERNTKRPEAKKAGANASDFDTFMTLLNGKDSNKRDIRKINTLLANKTGFYSLYRERLQHKHEHQNFIPVCTDDDKYKHSMKILKYYNINAKKNVDWTKFKSQLSNEEIACFSTKIHFLPIIIKGVTDLQLGDCSYLDTCHKFHQNTNNCKYVHYFEYRPVQGTNPRKREPRFVEFEECESDIDPLFTFNLSNYKKTPRKPVPVKCDIRYYDFAKLQKESFNAIIADPPWNIHMNLPYGTCNDQELFDLPLHKLQCPKRNNYYSVFDNGDSSSNRFLYKQGGIMALWVTVRSINLGKQLLVANGYKIVNELSWIKINQLCRTIVTGRTGHWLNHSKEHLLIGYKGNVDDWLLLRQQDLDYIVSHTRETSRKPDELYAIIERLCGEHSNNLELFGRDNNLRESWVTLGNQLD